MGKWKTVEIVLLAISTLIAAIKATMKFIEYIIKLRNRPSNSTA